MDPVDDTPAGLEREYSVLCADWDGVEVSARPGDVVELRSLVQRLCALGVDVAFVSDAVVAVVDDRLRARPDVEGRFFLCLSGGSEIYVIGPQGPRLLLRRQASEEEAARLAPVAAALGEELAARGHHVSVAYDGFSRWRIDLPTGPASDSLRGDLVELSHRLVKEAGLRNRGVAMDARHLHVGLTDRRDSLRAVLRLLIDDRRRDPSQLLIVGDGLGDFARFAAGGGRGLPHVISARGGVATLLGVLRDQLSRRTAIARAAFPEPTSDAAWRYEVHGFDPFREREIETLLTIANGESGTRGALEEGSAVSTPGTFVAGVFGDGTGDVRFRQPVPAPDWAGVRLVVGGAPLHLASGVVLEHHRVLDMRHGVVYRYWRQRDGVGRTVSVRTARFASLADRQLLGLRAEATAEDFAGRLIWQGATGISYAGGPLKEIEIQNLEDSRLLARSRGRNGGGHVLALATRPASGSPVIRYVDQGRDVIGGRLEPGDPATIDRLAAIVSARTRVPSSATAGRALDRAERLGYDELLRHHRAAWEARWRDADLVVSGDAPDQEALRFSIFHMISSAHPSKDTVSVGARGLSGMSYFLHVFWDTEIFVLPFYIYTHPETARTLLAYRFRHLAGAREKARQMGHRGALYPWESADKGVETTPPYGIGPGGEIVPILSGIMEHHISADVAWAVWEYWKATADDVFMAGMGVEMLLETARFWASRAVVGSEGRYHIRLVVGPDEYHEAVDDNAYTNVMARWNIRRALEAWRWLQRVDSGYAGELWERLGLTPAELEAWRAVAEGMVDGFDPHTLLYEQFAGFHALDDVPLEKLRPRPTPADMMLGREVTLRSKVVKQADVVMLTHVLSDEIADDVAASNYDYYEPITVHGSSLSSGMHAAVAARLGRVDDAVADFKMATTIDMGDTMGNAARGLHLATMGSLWQAAVMGFAGIQRRDEALLIDPHLPPAWRGLSVPFLFRGARLEFEFQTRDDTLHLGILIQRAPVRVILDGEERELHPARYALRRRPGGRWEEVPTDAADRRRRHSHRGRADRLGPRSAAAARWDVRAAHPQGAERDAVAGDLEGVELVELAGDAWSNLAKLVSQADVDCVAIGLNLADGQVFGAPPGNSSRTPRFPPPGPARNAVHYGAAATAGAARGHSLNHGRDALRGGRAVPSGPGDRHAERRHRPGSGRDRSLPAPRFIDQEQYAWSDWQDEFSMRFSQRAEGCRHRVSVLVGDPATTITEEAGASEVELIVLTWRGTFAEGHGHIVRRLLQESPCPLLIVPAGWTEGPRERRAGD